MTTSGSGWNGARTSSGGSGYSSGICGVSSRISNGSAPKAAGAARTPAAMMTRGLRVLMVTFLC